MQHLSFRFELGSPINIQYLDVISTCTWRPHIAGIHRSHHFTIFQIMKYVQYQYTYLGSLIYASIDIVHWPPYFSVCLFGATRGCLQFWTVHDMGLTNALNTVPLAAIIASTLDVGIAHFILSNFDLCTINLYNICACVPFHQYTCIHNMYPVSLYKHLQMFTVVTVPKFEGPRCCHGLLRRGRRRWSQDMLSFRWRFLVAIQWMNWKLNQLQSR